MPQIITNDVDELAERFVRRGVAWLNRYAPPDWERRMFDIRGGRATLRFNLSHDNENVLALAFTNIPELANQTGYVTFASVARCFGFRPMDRRLVALGFTGRTHWSSFERNALDEALTQAWENALKTYAAPSHVPPCHYRCRPRVEVHRGQTSRWGWLSDLAKVLGIRRTTA